MTRLIFISLILFSTISLSQNRRGSLKINNTTKKQDAVFKELKDNNDANKLMYVSFQKNLMEALTKEHLDILRNSTINDTLVISLDLTLNKKGIITNQYIKDSRNNTLFTDTKVTVKNLTSSKFHIDKTIKKNRSYFYINYDLLFTWTDKNKLNLSPIPFETKYTIPRQYILKNNPERINLVFKECTDKQDVKLCFYNTIQEAIFLQLQNANKTILLNDANDNILSVFINIYANKKDLLIKDISFPNNTTSAKIIQDYNSLFKDKTLAHLSKIMPNNLNYYSSEFNVFFKLDTLDNGTLKIDKLPFDYTQKFYRNKTGTTRKNTPPIHPNCVNLDNNTAQLNCLDNTLKRLINKQFIVLENDNSNNYITDNSNDMNERFILKLFVNKTGVIDVLSAYGEKKTENLEQVISIIQAIPKMTPAKDPKGNPAISFLQLPFRLVYN